MVKLGIGLLAGSAAFFAAVSGAQAAPALVYLRQDTVQHVANDGQTNVVNVSVSGSRLIVKDTAGLTAGEGCKQTDSLTVSCPKTNSIVLDLKDGNDIVNTSASGVKINAYGGPGNDILNGGSSSDGLSGGEGNDIINGNGGDDGLSGGTGDDVVNGGEGDDSIDDNDGKDVLAGGPGNDQIFDYGGAGDVINGDAGNDTIFSLDDLKDTINCGAGSDQYATNPEDLRNSCETSLN
jgi:Ca2+-binding RTX toxin-like protein